MSVEIWCQHCKIQLNVGFLISHLSCISLYVTDVSNRDLADGQLLKNSAWKYVIRRVDVLHKISLGQLAFFIKSTQNKSSIWFYGNVVLYNMYKVYFYGFALRALCFCVVHPDVHPSKLSHLLNISKTA